MPEATRLLLMRRCPNGCTVRRGFAGRGAVLRLAIRPYGDGLVRIHKLWQSMVLHREEESCSAVRFLVSYI